MCVCVCVYVYVCVAVQSCPFCCPSSLRHRYLGNFSGAFEYARAYVCLCVCICVLRHRGTAISVISAAPLRVDGQG